MIGCVQLHSFMLISAWINIFYEKSICYKGFMAVEGSCKQAICFKTVNKNLEHGSISN